MTTFADDLLIYQKDAKTENNLLADDDKKNALEMLWDEKKWVARESISATDRIHIKEAGDHLKDVKAKIRQEKLNVAPEAVVTNAGSTNYSSPSKPQRRVSPHAMSEMSTIQEEVDGDDLSEDVSASAVGENVEAMDDSIYRDLQQGVADSNLGPIQKRVLGGILSLDEGGVQSRDELNKIVSLFQDGEYHDGVDIKYILRDIIRKVGRVNTDTKSKITKAALKGSDSLSEQITFSVDANRAPIAARFRTLLMGSALVTGEERFSFDGKQYSISKNLFLDGDREEDREVKNAFFNDVADPEQHQQANEAARTGATDSKAGRHVRFNVAQVDHGAASVPGSPVVQRGPLVNDKESFQQLQKRFEKGFAAHQDQGLNKSRLSFRQVSDAAAVARKAILRRTSHDTEAAIEDPRLQSTTHSTPSLLRIRDNLTDQTKVKNRVAEFDREEAERSQRGGAGNLARVRLEEAMQRNLESFSTTTIQKLDPEDDGDMSAVESQSLISRESSQSDGYLASIEAESGPESNDGSVVGDAYPNLMSPATDNQMQWLQPGGEHNLGVPLVWEGGNSGDDAAGNVIDAAATQNLQAAAQSPIQIELVANVAEYINKEQEGSRVRMQGQTLLPQSIFGTMQQQGSSMRGPTTDRTHIATENDRILQDLGRQVRGVDLDTVNDPDSQPKRSMFQRAFGLGKSKVQGVVPKAQKAKKRRVKESKSGKVGATDLQQHGVLSSNAGGAFMQHSPQQQEILTTSFSASPVVSSQKRESIMVSGNPTVDQPDNANAIGYTPPEAASAKGKKDAKKKKKKKASFPVDPYQSTPVQAVLPDDVEILSPFDRLKDRRDITEEKMDNVVAGAFARRDQQRAAAKAAGINPARSTADVAGGRSQSVRGDAISSQQARAGLAQDIGSELFGDNPVKHFYPKGGERDFEWMQSQFTSTQSGEKRSGLDVLHHSIEQGRGSSSQLQGSVVLVGGGSESSENEWMNSGDLNRFSAGGYGDQINLMGSAIQRDGSVLQNDGSPAASDFSESEYIREVSWEAGGLWQPTGSSYGQPTPHIPSGSLPPAQHCFPTNTGSHDKRPPKPNTPPLPPPAPLTFANPVTYGGPATSGGLMAAIPPSSLAAASLTAAPMPVAATTAAARPSITVSKDAKKSLQQLCEKIQLGRDKGVNAVFTPNDKRAYLRSLNPNNVTKTLGDVDRDFDRLLQVVNYGGPRSAVTVNRSSPSGQQVNDDLLDETFKKIAAVMSGGASGSIVRSSPAASTSDPAAWKATSAIFVGSASAKASYSSPEPLATNTNPPDLGGRIYL
jgi:hypothetical protein